MQTANGTAYRTNGLTLAEEERLEMLAEEAGEVVQAAMKILRHGYNSYNPDNIDHVGNRGELEKEIGDFAAIVEMMFKTGEISETRVKMRIPEKRSRVMKYAHHQEKA